MRAIWVVTVLSVLVVVLVMGVQQVDRMVVGLCNPPVALWHGLWWWVEVLAVVVRVVVVGTEVRAGESRQHKVVQP
jgi:hypothetical protein